MLLNQMDFMVARERHDDLLREAEHQRLVRTAERAQAGNHKFVQRAIAWIGDQLVRCGWTLQRYGMVQPAQMPQIAGQQFEREI